MKQRYTLSLQSKRIIQKETNQRRAHDQSVKADTVRALYYYYRPVRLIDSTQNERSHQFIQTHSVQPFNVIH